MEKTRERYRRNAEDCRLQASRCSSSEDRDRWLRMADEWERLAGNAVGVPPPSVRRSMNGGGSDDRGPHAN